MTQISEAKKGGITKEMTEVAKTEGIAPSEIQKGIAEGTIVICKNKVHKIKPLGIGKGLRTKINANIGTSKDYNDIE